MQRDAIFILVRTNREGFSAITSEKPLTGRRNGNQGCVCVLGEDAVNSQAQGWA